MPTYAEEPGSPDETWKIGRRTFEIYPQQSNTWGVKVRKQGEGEIWIHTPTENFETLGGCYHAILLFLERNHA